MARLLYFLEKNIPTLFWLLLSIIRIARPKKKKKKKNTLVSINKGDEKILTRAAAKLFFLIDFP